MRKDENKGGMVIRTKPSSDEMYLRFRIKEYSQKSTQKSEERKRSN